MTDKENRPPNSVNAGSGSGEWCVHCAAREKEIAALQSKVVDRQKQIDCLEATLTEFQDAFCLYVEANRTRSGRSSDTELADCGELNRDATPSAPVSPLNAPCISDHSSHGCKGSSMGEGGSNCSVYLNNPFTYGAGGLENLAVRMRSLNSRITAVREHVESSSSNTMGDQHVARRRRPTQSYIRPSLSAAATDKESSALFVIEDSSTPTKTRGPQGPGPVPVPGPGKESTVTLLQVQHATADTIESSLSTGAHPRLRRRFGTEVEETTTAPYDACPGLICTPDDADEDAWSDMI